MPHTLNDRLIRVQELILRARVDRLVCVGNGHHMIDLENPVFHLTGYRSVGPALLEYTNGRMRLVTSPADDADAILDVMTTEAIAVDDFDAEARKVLGGKQRTGIVGFDAMPRRLAQSLLMAIGGEPKTLDAEFFAATAVKTDEEIAAVRRATTLAEEGFEQLLESIPGRIDYRECDLAADINRYMRQRGADDSFLMLNCGPRQDAVMPSSERVIENGDLLLTELSPSVKGQFTQICRTVTIGAANPQAAEKYPLLVAAMNAGIERVKPGARVADVCMAIDDHLSAAGYEKFSRPPFIRRRGHGLGSGNTAPGDVAVDNETVLEAGMILMVHPNQFLPETGYMMCGEPVLVTETGHEVLTTNRARLATVKSVGSHFESTRQ